MNMKAEAKIARQRLSLLAKHGQRRRSLSAAHVIADMGVWQVHRPDVSDVLEAIRVGATRQLSFWDATILTSARCLGCEVLWSEDLNARQVYRSTRA